MRNLNLDQLQTFARVVELGSFSAAARHLNLTQPAISLQIRQLEARLRVPLLERTGRRTTPTAAGTELLGHTRQIQSVVTAACDDMARHAQGDLGRVRLGTGASACIYRLPPLLRELRRRHPSLEIIITTGNARDIVEAVEDNAIDVGFVTLPVASRSLDIRPVLREEFVAIEPADDARLSARPTPAELSAGPLILFEPGGNTRRLVDDWFLGAGVTAKPIMSLGNVEGIKQLVGAGLGCAILPSKAVADPDPNVLVKPVAPPLHRELAIALRRDKRLVRGLRETVKALEGLR